MEKPIAWYSNHGITFLTDVELVECEECKDA